MRREFERVEDRARVAVAERYERGAGVFLENRVQVGQAAFGVGQRGVNYARYLLLVELFEGIDPRSGQ